MFPLALSFAGAFCLALILTYVVRGWAVKGGWVDIPDGDRRCHTHPVPRLGGVAIFLSFTIAWLVVFAGFPHTRLAPGDPASLFALILGGMAMFGVGVWDDVRGLSAKVKLALQTAIALGVFFAGIRIESLGLLTSGGPGLPYWLSLGLTTLWIVGITNAFNLIDGSDGVAGGAALFASVSIVVVMLLFGNHEGAVLAMVLAGAILGFLFFNFPPATIFLGDSGSLFIGFTLAALGVITTQTASTTLAVVIPVVSCGLPILDTLLAVVRRFLRGDPIFQPDRGHIHHRLRDMGLSSRNVALLLYTASAGFAVASLLLVEPSTRATASLVLMVTGAAAWLSIQRLHIPELLEVQRIVRRGLKQRVAIANNVRIREALRRMRAAADYDALGEAMGCAFQSGEFQRVELWIRESSAPALRHARTFRPSRAGFRWVWRGAAGQQDEALWEVQLPFRDAGGRVIGRLSLWRSTESNQLLTDIRLLALELQPEFHAALARLTAVGSSHSVRAEQPVLATETRSALGSL